MSYHNTSFEVRANFAGDGRKRHGGEFCLNHHRIFTLKRSRFGACLLPMPSLPFTPFLINNVQGDRSTIPRPTTQSLTAVYMVDANNGWVVGIGGTISSDITREWRG